MITNDYRHLQLESVLIVELNCMSKLCSSHNTLKSIYIRFKYSRNLDKFYSDKIINFNKQKFIDLQ